MDFMEIYLERQRRTEWFRNVRFGMFIHWGIYSIPARGEWVQSVERTGTEDYRRYFDEFDPDRYDPLEWARLAKQSGMKYAVLTAKHHDGFCLFDSSHTDFKSTRTKTKRDLVAEYLEAFRSEGLKVGLYYSLVDWHHPGYPAYGDRQHPMRDNLDYKGISHDFDSYLDYMHAQVRELCTNYGKLDILWFDFSYWQMKGETWRATELVEMIRTLQPDVIIDNRLGGDMTVRMPEAYAGDFAGPEQNIPQEPICNEEGLPLPWEACITLNNNWGYASADGEYKDAGFVIRTLARCVSKGGNLLVNVGPNARGEIPKPAKAILQNVGLWMADNSESIYGCGISKMERPDWGCYTQNGNHLYMHVFDTVLGHICLPGLRGRIKKARRVSDRSEVLVTDFWNADNGVEKLNCDKDIYVNFAHPVMNTYRLPDPLDTVVELELE